MTVTPASGADAVVVVTIDVEVVVAASTALTVVSVVVVGAVAVGSLVVVVGAAVVVGASVVSALSSAVSLHAGNSSTTRETGTSQRRDRERIIRRPDCPGSRESMLGSSLSPFPLDLLLI
jgi:hypothetical protein